jgi:hypothetical protein
LRGVNQKTNDENDACELIKQKAKEKQAADQRASILAYAKDGLMTLQTVHSSTSQPIKISLNFQQLKKAVRSTEPPIEFLGHFVPQTLTCDTTANINRLNEEINELRQLRQAVLELQPEDVHA